MIFFLYTLASASLKFWVRPHRDLNQNIPKLLDAGPFLDTKSSFVALQKGMGTCCLTDSSAIHIT